MGANIQKNIVFVIFAKQFLLLIIAEYFVDYDTFERFFVPLFREGEGECHAGDEQEEREDGVMVA